MCDTTHLNENNRVSSTRLPVDSQRLENVEADISVDGRLEENEANYVVTWQSTLFMDDGTAPEWHKLTYPEKRNQDFFYKKPLHA
jgi:hypothetical protein